MASGALLTVDWDRLSADFARREAGWLGPELDRAQSNGRAVISRAAVDDALTSGAPDRDALRSAWAGAVMASAATPAIKIILVMFFLPLDLGPFWRKPPDYRA